MISGEQCMVEVYKLGFFYSRVCSLCTTITFLRDFKSILEYHEYMANFRGSFASSQKVEVFLGLTPTQHFMYMLQCFLILSMIMLEWIYMPEIQK